MRMFIQFQILEFPVSIGQLESRIFRRAECYLVFQFIHWLSPAICQRGFDLCTSTQHRNVCIGNKNGKYKIWIQFEIIQFPMYIVELAGSAGTCGRSTSKSRRFTAPRKIYMVRRYKCNREYSVRFVSLNSKSKNFLLRRQDHIFMTYSVVFRVWFFFSRSSSCLK